MAKFHEKLDNKMRDFITKQHVYFVATAPHKGRVHLAPKGLDTFRVISDTEAAYLDLTGSGNEAAAHLLENGRLTVMFCSFNEAPLTLRLFGSGRIILPNSSDWPQYYRLFEPRIGHRQIILISIESVQTSCGFATPFYEYVGERPTLDEWAVKRGEEGLKTYRLENNALSIDGLPTGIEG